MENEKDKTTEAQKNPQPKPTDDVQLEIETVVPSAHKEEATTSSTEKTEDKTDNSVDAESTDNDDSETEKKDDSDGKQDDIETITPSA